MVILSIAGIILLYWLFMIFTIKLKKCMFLNKICMVIMVSKVCLGIFISAAAIICIVVSTVTINLCTIYDKSFSDKSLSDVVLEQAKKTNSQFVEYAQKCAYKPNGNLRDFISPPLQSDYDNILKKFDSLRFIGRDSLQTYRTSTSTQP